MGVEDADLVPVSKRRARTSAATRAPSPPDVSDPADHSLVDDIEALISDGKTYVEAEIAFQKSRAGFAASGAKRAAVFGLAALAFLHLALIALVVGLVIALVPLVGAWGATGIVTGLLLLGAFLLVQRVRASVGEIAAVFQGDEA